MADNKTGPEFIRATIELFHDLYTDYTNKVIDHVTVLSVGGTYVVDYLCSNLKEVEQAMDRDQRFTIGAILDALVESSILERFTDGDKVVYKPHNQFNEVLKNGKW